MATPANAAANATQTVEPPRHKEVEHFSDAERTEWLKTGNMPPLEKDSSLEADASAASKPASEAGKSGDRGKESGSGPGKKERDDDKNWRALESERDTLKAAREAAENELKEWREGKRKPEEKKEPAVKLLEMPLRPKMKDFLAEGVLDSDKYEEALDKYETDKTAYINQQTQIRTASAQQEAAIKTWSAELKEKYGDKASGLDVKKTADTLASTMQDAPAFFMFLQDSDVFTDLLYVLGTDPKLDELLAEARDPKTATRAIRKLVLLENGVKSELAKNEAAKGKTDEGDEKKEKQLTKAGKPPSEAAGASSSPADDGSANAAWQRKDLSVAERGELYRERKNAEDRTKRKKKAN